MGFLEDEIESLRAAAREGHESIQELKDLVREAKAVRDELKGIIPTLTEDLVAEEVKRQLDAFRQAMDEHKQGVQRKLDKHLDGILKEINKKVGVMK